MYKLALFLLAASAGALANPVPCKKNPLNSTRDGSNYLIEKKLFRLPGLDTNENSQPILSQPPRPVEEVRPPTAGQIIDHTVNAIHITIKDQRDAIWQNLQKIIQKTGHNIDLGIEAAKTGFDIVLLLPKAVKNTLTIPNKGA